MVHCLWAAARAAANIHGDEGTLWRRQGPWLGCPGPSMQSCEGVALGWACAPNLLRPFFCSLGRGRYTNTGPPTCKVNFAGWVLDRPAHAHRTDRIASVSAWRNRARCAAVRMAHERSIARSIASRRASPKSWWSMESSLSKLGGIRWLRPNIRSSVPAGTRSPTPDIDRDAAVLAGRHLQQVHAHHLVEREAPRRAQHTNSRRTPACLKAWVELFIAPWPKFRCTLCECRR